MDSTPRSPLISPHHPLVPEVPVAGKHHGDAMFIRCTDHLPILHTAAGLNHGFRPGLRQHIHAITEREEGI